MGEEFKKLRWLLALVLILYAPSVTAQQITLKSGDGSITLSGTLLGYDGEFYRIKSRFGAMTIAALGVSCQGAGCPDPAQYAADITLSGSALPLENLLPGLIEDFGFSNGLTTLRTDQAIGNWTYFVSDPTQIPIARIDATHQPTAAAFLALAQNHSDIILARRLPTAAEAMRAKRANIGDLYSRYRQQVLALDGLVFLVSPDNPVSSLSRQEIADIFAGKITNWSDVGGINAPIDVFQRPATSEIATDFFTTVFPGHLNFLPQSTHEFASASTLSDALVQNPLAIGYTGMAGIRNAKPLAIRGGCGIVQHPDAFSLRTGDYPLTRQYFLFTPQRRLPVFAREFLAYLKTPRAQSQVDALGFVGLKQDALLLSQQQDRLSNAISAAGRDVPLATLKGFITALSGARRLPATFRFNDNSVDMDVLSTRAVRSIVQMIESGEFDGHDLIFAGFSDAAGGASANRRVSRSRAEKISRLVRARAVRADLSKVNFRALGFGEVSPLACNDTAQGRQTNRRVEIWVR